MCFHKLDFIPDIDQESVPSEGLAMPARRKPGRDIALQTWATPQQNGTREKEMETVLVEIDGPVATVTYNRPERRNGWHPQEVVGRSKGREKVGNNGRSRG